MLDGTRTWISVAPHLPTAGTKLLDGVRKLSEVERRFRFSRPPARQAYRVRAHGRAGRILRRIPSEVIEARCGGAHRRAWVRVRAHPCPWQRVPRRHPPGRHGARLEIALKIEGGTIKEHMKSDVQQAGGVDFLSPLLTKPPLGPVLWDVKEPRNGANPFEVMNLKRKVPSGSAYT